MKIVKEKVIQLWNALSEIGNEKNNAKFSYAIARNLNAIEAEVKALTQAQKVSKEYQEYDAERMKICMEMARKDDTGHPLMIGAEFDIEDRATFDKKIEKLQKKNRKIIDTQMVQIEQFNELIKEEIDLEFYNIKIEYLPEDIKPNHVALMMDFIVGVPADE